MRTIVISFTLTILAAVAVAQQPAAPAPQAMKLYASSADVTALIANAKANTRPDAPTIQRIAGLAPYSLNLEYRPKVFTANVHEKEAEMFYVLDGSATLVTGGKLTDAKRQNAENLAGPGIEGGTSQEVAKGDVILVPENTPHWFSVIHQSPLIVMSLHVPRTTGSTAN
jgi:mannose-6-phosphate isomerase-like protein (cupin superfamily)